MDASKKLNDMAKGKEEAEFADADNAEREALKEITEFSALIIINEKVKEGQSKTGLLSLADCEAHMHAVEVVFKTLRKLHFNMEGDLTPDKVNAEELRSLSFIKAVVDALQAKAAFELEESVEILGKIRIVDAIFADNFDEELVKARVEAAFQGKKNDMAQSRKKGGGKGKKGKGKK
jgi:hypothetical protein